MRTDIKRADRRITKTKRSIRDAFFGLNAERGFAAITVSALCERANINRNTFYYHYADVQALFDELSGELVREMEAVYRAELLPLERSRAICRIFSEHSQLVGILNDGYAGAILLWKLTRAAGKYVKRDLRIQYPYISASELDIITAYVLHGSMKAILHWMEEASDISLEDMAALLNAIMERGTSALKLRGKGG